jgi:undecaprenyl-diphosphatase
VGAVSAGGFSGVPLILLAVLALVQGLTELLPISSSAHLILTWEVFARLEQPVDLGGQQELMLDIAGHIGTLAAIVLYFWRDVLAILAGAFRLLTGRLDRGSRLFLLVLISAIPAAVAGFLIKDLAAEELRLVELIAWTQIGFGLLLYLADRIGMTIRKIEHLRIVDVVVLGLAQALALVPGTSRSGITMTAGRFLGLERSEAARFSFLMAMPTIAGAGILAGLDLAAMGEASAALGTDALITAALSFFASLAAVAFLMAWIRRQSFTIFVVYRVALGAFLLWLVYSGTLEGLHF